MNGIEGTVICLLLLLVIWESWLREKGKEQERQNQFHRDVHQKMKEVEEKNITPVAIKTRYDDANFSPPDNRLN